jgi:hypothetical protein
LFGSADVRQLKRSEWHVMPGGMACSGEWNNAERPGAPDGVFLVDGGRSCTT